MSASLVGSEMCIRDRFSDNSLAILGQRLGNSCVRLHVQMYVCAFLFMFMRGQYNQQLKFICVYASCGCALLCLQTHAVGPLRHPRFPKASRGPCSPTASPSPKASPPQGLPNASPNQPRR
eukprot:553684-Alexandrium_andersonii.AAC.1